MSPWEHSGRDGLLIWCTAPILIAGLIWWRALRASAHLWAPEILIIDAGGPGGGPYRSGPTLVGERYGAPGFARVAALVSICMWWSGCPLLAVDPLLGDFVWLLGVFPALAGWLLLKAERGVVGSLAAWLGFTVVFVYLWLPQLVLAAAITAPGAVAVALARWRYRLRLGGG